MSNLHTVGSWASIASTAVSIFTLLLVGSVRSRVIDIRRKNRLRGLVEDIRSIPDDALPLSSASISKLEALSRNIPYGMLCLFSKKSRAARDMQIAIKERDLLATKEAMEDWLSHTEDL